MAERERRERHAATMRAVGIAEAEECPGLDADMGPSPRRAEAIDTLVQLARRGTP